MFSTFFNIEFQVNIQCFVKCGDLTFRATIPFLHSTVFGIFFCQNQDVVPISSYDTAGSFLILGCNNGSIYYIGESHMKT